MREVTDENVVQLPPVAAARAGPKRRWALALPVALFGFIAFFVAADMVADLHAGVSAAHLAIESFALALTLYGVWRTARALRAAFRESSLLRRDLEGTRADLARWRAEAQELLRGLGVAIDEQLQRWELTSAEREVALLILKGCSYKEVAEARATSERTARHQALAVYRKAGLTGRAELAAFFLQDLLLPRGGAAGRGHREAEAPVTRGCPGPRARSPERARPA